VSYLFENSPNEFNAPTIAKATGIKQATVNMALARLLKKGQVTREARGFYKYREEERKKPVELSEGHVSFHGIQMVANLSKLEGGSPLLSTSITGTEKAPEWVLEGNKRVFEASWRQRRVRIMHAPSTLEASLTTSENSLTVPELDAYLSYLEGLFYPDFYSYAWVFRSIGINVDRAGYWIEGCNSITMKDARGYIARWYNKQGIGVRQEVHMYTNLGLDEVVSFLRGNAPLGVSDLREQVNALEKGIRALSSDNRRTRVMLTRFIEILHDMSPEPTILAYDDRHIRGGPG
jgi:hypothetical protein